MLNVYINCKSPLLQKSLEIFLKDYKTSYRNADAVISDRAIKTSKRLLTIGNKEEDRIKKPFTKSSLMLILDREKKQIDLSKNMAIADRDSDAEIDLNLQIQKLSERFATELTTLILSKVK